MNIKYDWLIKKSFCLSERDSGSDRGNKNDIDSASDRGSKNDIDSASDRDIYSDRDSYRDSDHAACYTLSVRYSDSDKFWQTLLW